MGDFCAVSLKLRSEIKRLCYRKSNILMVFGQMRDNPIFWGFWVAILACQLWDRSIIKWPYRLFFRWKNWTDLLRNILLLKNLDFSYARNILDPNFFMCDILRILIRDNRIFWLFWRILSGHRWVWAHICILGRWICSGLIFMLFHMFRGVHIIFGGFLRGEFKATLRNKKVVL